MTKIDRILHEVSRQARLALIATEEDPSGYALPEVREAVLRYQVQVCRDALASLRWQAELALETARGEVAL